MKEYDGELNFATDAWTSPNHRAFMAIMVHLAWEGKPSTMVLDFIEVARVHSILLPLWLSAYGCGSHIRVKHLQKSLQQP